MSDSTSTTARKSGVDNQGGYGARRPIDDQAVSDETTRNPMCHSTTFKPFGKWEIRAVRWLAQIDRDFESAFASLIRIQFLRAVMGGLLGPRGTHGLASAETILMLSIAARPAASRDQVRRKALLVRSFAGADHNEHGNTVAMLSTALEADCERLGILVHTFGRPSPQDRSQAQ